LSLSEVSWDQTLKNWEQNIKAFNDLFTKYNAVLNKYSKGKISDMQFYEELLPVVLSLLKNYEEQAAYANAFIDFLKEENNELNTALKLYEKFIRKMGLQHRFNKFSDKRRRIKN